MALTTKKSKNVNPKPSKAEARMRNKNTKGSSSKTFQSPLVFKDATYSVQYHDFKVFIQGVEVSPFVTSDITVNYALSSPHTASFSLDNAGNKFVMTSDNMKNWSIRSIYSGSGIFKYRKAEISAQKAFDTMLSQYKDSGSTLSRDWEIYKNKDKFYEGAAPTSYTVNNNLVQAHNEKKYLQAYNIRQKKWEKEESTLKKNTEIEKNYFNSIKTQGTYGLQDMYSELPKARIYAFKMGKMFSDSMKLNKSIDASVDKEAAILNYQETKQPPPTLPPVPPTEQVPNFDDIFPLVPSKAGKDSFSLITSYQRAKGNNIITKKQNSKPFKAYLEIYTRLHTISLMYDPKEQQDAYITLEKDFNSKLKTMGNIGSQFQSFKNSYWGKFAKTAQYQKAYGKYLKELEEYKKKKAEYDSKSGDLGDVQDSHYGKTLNTDKLGLEFDYTSLNQEKKVVLFTYNVLATSPQKQITKDYYWNKVKNMIIDRVMGIFNYPADDSTALIKVRVLVDMGYQKFFSIKGWSKRKLNAKGNAKGKTKKITLNKNASTLNMADKTTGELMWSFGIGRSVFHKYDPIRIFIANPYVPPEINQWLPKFTGFLDGAQVNKNHVTKTSTVSMSCVDLKHLMSRMRVQTNSIIPKGNDVVIRKMKLEGNRWGLFKDYLHGTNERKVNIFQNKNLIKIFDALILNKHYKLGRYRRGYKVEYPVSKDINPIHTYELVYLKQQLNFYAEEAEKQKRIKNFVTNKKKDVIYNAFNMALDGEKGELTRATSTILQETASEYTQGAIAYLDKYGGGTNKEDPVYKMAQDWAHIYKRVNMNIKRRAVIDELESLELKYTKEIEETRLGGVDTVLAYTLAKAKLPEIQAILAKNKEEIKNIDDEELDIQNEIDILEGKVNNIQKSITEKVKYFANKLKGLKEDIKKLEEKKASVTKNIRDNTQILAKWHNLSLLGLYPETTKDMLLGQRDTVSSFAQYKPKFLTEENVNIIGKLSYTDGPWGVDTGFFHMLLPHKGSGMTQLTKSGVNIGNTSITWAYRASLLDDFTGLVDYRWFLTPMGDIILEFPMYDFYPEDFGKSLEDIFKTTEGMISENYTDEQGDFPTALVVHAGISNIHADFTVSMPQDLKRRVWIKCPILMKRLGMKEAEKTFNFIYDRKMLIRIALVTMQKRIADANKMQVTMTAKEFVWLNRPFFNIDSMRMGVIDSINYTYPLDGEETMGMNIAQVRTMREDFSFRFLSGGAHLPLTYRDRYNANFKGSRGHIEGMSWEIKDDVGTGRTGTAIVTSRYKKGATISTENTANQESPKTCTELSSLRDAVRAMTSGKKNKLGMPNIPMYQPSASARIKKIPNVNILCGMGGPADEDSIERNGNIREVLLAHKPYVIRAKLRRVLEKLRANKGHPYIVRLENDFLKASRKLKKTKPDTALLSSIKKWNIRGKRKQCKAYKNISNLTIAKLITAIGDMATVLGTIKRAKSVKDLTNMMIPPNNFQDQVIFLLNEGFNLLYILIGRNLQNLNERVAPEPAEFLWDHARFPKTPHHRNGGVALSDLDSLGNDFFFCPAMANGKWYLGTFAAEIAKALIKADAWKIAEFEDIRFLAEQYLDAMLEGATLRMKLVLGHVRNGSTVPMRLHFYFIFSLYYYVKASTEKKHKKYKKLAKRLESLNNAFVKGFHRSRVFIIAPTSGEKSETNLALFRTSDARIDASKSCGGHQCLESSYNACWAMGEGHKHSPRTNNVDVLYYTTRTSSELDPDTDAKAFVLSLLSPKVFDLEGISWMYLRGSNLKGPTEIMEILGPCKGATLPD